MSIDIDASIKATTERTERELGSSLMLQERASVRNSMSHEWLSE